MPNVQRAGYADSWWAISVMTGGRRIGEVPLSRLRSAISSSRVIFGVSCR